MKIVFLFLSTFRVVNEHLDFFQKERIHKEIFILTRKREK